MDKILAEIGKSPALAWLGFAVIVALLLVPVVLRIAGLTGSQIVTLLRSMIDALVLLVKEFRAENRNDAEK